MVGGTLRRGGGGGSCAGYFAGNRSLVTGKSPNGLRQAPPPSGLHSTIYLKKPEKPETAQILTELHHIPQ